MSETDGKKRKTSVVWRYFTKIGSTQAKCNCCQKTFFYRSSTSNLKRHYNNKHGFGNNKRIELGESNNDSPENNTEDFDIKYVEEDNEEDLEHEVQITPSFKKPPSKYTNTYHPTKRPMQQKNNTHRPKLDNAEMIQQAINILSNVSCKNNITDNDDDEFSQFGKYVSDQLRGLPSLNALQLQEKIYCLITRERVAVMTNNSKIHSYVKSFNVQFEEQEECTEQNNQQEWSSPQVETSHSLVENLIEETVNSSTPASSIVLSGNNDS